MPALFLETDAVYHGKALDSVAALLGWEQTEVDGMRQRWSTVIDGMQYEIGWHSMDAGTLKTWTDRDGAKAFIYGHLVHGP